MRKWITAGKGKYGLTYREHLTLTTGVARSKRPLRYYRADYKVNGIKICDTYGWETDFKGGHHEIEQLALQFKINRKAGVSPGTYKEHIELQKQANLLELEPEPEVHPTRLCTVWQNYCRHHRNKISLSNEIKYYGKWIGPIIGDMLLEDIQLADLDEIKEVMEDMGRAPATINHIKSIIRQLYNFATERQIYYGGIPTQYFLKGLKLNNKRSRFLKVAEADDLFRRLRRKSLDCYRITLISLHTGMRFGEIAKLRWMHVKENGFDVLDPKNEEDRTASWTKGLAIMFESMKRGKPGEHVFPDRNGGERSRMSESFARVVNDMGLNDGIDDRRLKVVFHSIRHTCASWLANNGEDLQVIGKVLGHRSPVSTKRYSHIGDKTVSRAVSVFDEQMPVDPDLLTTGEV